METTSSGLPRFSPSAPSWGEMREDGSCFKERFELADAARRGDNVQNPLPPTILYEYQNKGLTEFAIRKSLILKGAILVVYG